MITLFRYHNGSDKALAKFIHNIFGFYPKNISLFQLAFTHKSIANRSSNGLTISNERLEYLGDAILSAVVAEFLFKKFPAKQEGFLTEMRSRIVSRSSLNKLSQKFGFEKMINCVKPMDGHSKMRSLGGNAFEAFTGALFLDRGYDFTYKVIVDRVIRLHVDIESLEKNETNFKSRLLEWAQKEKHHVDFRQIDHKNDGYDKLYVIQVFIDEKEFGKASDYSIKGAEQLAAEKTWHIFNPQNEVP